MADALVFHLMKLTTDGRVSADVVLRYRHDPRCIVDEGDEWERTATDGEVTIHRVLAIRTYFGEDGEELHSFMSQVAVKIVQQ